MARRDATEASARLKDLRWLEPVIRTRSGSELRKRLDRQEIPSLNGLRTIACLAVITYHGGYPLAGLSAGSGVMLFFVLSGFLITWLLLKERDKHGEVSLFNFYVRRSLRIFPALFLYLVLVVCLLLWRHSPISWGHVLSCAFYFNNYYYAVSTNTIGWLQHAWSLAVEEQYYLLWPTTFVLFASRKALGRLLCICIPVCWVIRATACLAGVPDRYLYRGFEMRADQLLVGCLLAVLVFNGTARRVVDLVSRPVSALVAIALLELSLHLDSSLTYRYVAGAAVEPLLLACLLLQAVTMGSRVLDLPPMRYLGRISYGLYLYHELGFTISERICAPGSLLSVAVAFAATTGLAALSFHLFEQPILGLKDRLQRRRVPRSLARDLEPVPALSPAS